MEGPSGVNILLGVGTSFRTLYCRMSLRSYLVLPCLEEYAYIATWHCSGTLGPGFVCHAQEDVWLCFDYQALICPYYGSQL
jgi:hypothetical protein